MKFRTLLRSSLFAWALAALSPVLRAASLSITTAPSLESLEQQAPRQWGDAPAIARHNDGVLALIERNQLNTGAEFRRAALLLGFDLG